MVRLIQSPSGAVILRSSLLEACGIPHAFSTRIGGISEGPFATLNFGNPNPCDRRDPPENIRENFRRLLAAAGIEPTREIVEVHQVHGADVHEVHPDAPAHPGPSSTRADSILTSDPARALAIRTADCAPVLFASHDGRWVAAVHAGWRGTIAGVVSAAVERLRERHGGAWVAAIGPCIGAEAFEVGDEVADGFARAFGAASRTPHPRQNGKWLIDLPAALIAQLRAAGVEHIDLAQACTFSNSELFFSHRRDQGMTGRMASIIAPAAAATRL
jgi:polyphenol oxidase